MRCRLLHALYMGTYWWQYRVAHREPRTLKFMGNLRNFRVNVDSVCLEPWLNDLTLNKMWLCCVSTTVTIQRDSRHVKTNQEAVSRLSRASGCSRFQWATPVCQAPLLPSTSSPPHFENKPHKHSDKRLVSGGHGHRKQMEIISHPTRWQGRQMQEGLCSSLSILSTPWPALSFSMALVTTWQTACIYPFTFYHFSSNQCRNSPEQGLRVHCSLL